MASALPHQLRPTGLGSAINKDRPDYTVIAASVLSAASTRPVAVLTLRWFVANCSGPITRSDRVATLEKARAQFQKSAWTAWEKLEEVP